MTPTSLKAMPEPDSTNAGCRATGRAWLFICTDAHPDRSPVYGPGIEFRIVDRQIWAAFPDDAAAAGAFP